MMPSYRRQVVIILSAFTAAALTLPAWASTEIQFWHAMDGPAGIQVDAIAQRFNDSQPAVRVIPAYKGSYDETVAAAFDAQRAGRPPHIVQVYELGTADMIAARGAVRPVWQVMAQSGERFDAKAFLPALASYFSDAGGRLLALPFNTSTPVLYYNKDAFRAARLDPDRPPRTWYEMVPVLAALKDSGLPCAYATSWQSWVLVENTSAWHNQEFATRSNGVAGADAKLVFNTHLMMRHISTLASWVKADYFTYTGQRDEAERRFKRGECGLITASSASYADLRNTASFDLGVAQLPYYDDIKGAPQNTLIGGAGLWVMSGRPNADYGAAAKFLAYLMQPQVQAEWHQKSGYVPVTKAAYERSLKAGHYGENPSDEIAIRQLLLRHQTRESKGIRLGFFPQIRAVIDEELDAVWAMSKTPKEALDAAAQRGNALLRRFEAANEPGRAAGSVLTKPVHQHRAQAARNMPPMRE